LNFAKNFKEAISLVFIMSKGGDEFAKDKLAHSSGKSARDGNRRNLQ